MKAVIKHKKQRSRKPLWGAEVMLHWQGNTQMIQILHTLAILQPQWILQRHTIRQRVPASGINYFNFSTEFINSFPNKDERTVNAFTEAESGQGNTQPPELQVSSAPLSLPTLVRSTQDWYVSTTCVTHPHLSMSEHIKLTQTRYSQFFAVQHGLKTSMDSSH